MKKIKNLLALSFCLVVLTALFSCSKDDAKGPRNVEFKVTASSNATISTVVHTSAQGDVTTLTSLSGNTWSTTLTINGDVSAISLGANATVTDATGTLKVQILIDGVVVKENTGSGQILTATSTYMVAQ